MTEKEIELVVKLWNDGKSTTEIARVLPYKEYRVRREIVLLRQNGVLNGKSGKTKEKALAKILQAYNSGITSPYIIADMFNMNLGTVNTYLTQCKLGRTRPPQNYKKTKTCEKTQKIIEEIKTGFRLTEIAKKYNVTKQYVYNLKVRNKLYEKA